MPATLVRTAPTIPAQSAGTRPTPDTDAALVQWAAGLGTTERGIALAVSDMPRKRADIAAALGHPGPVLLSDASARPFAALVLARWIEQGVQRLGGEIEVWKYSMAMRRNGRRVTADGESADVLREYRELCKPLGGVQRWNTANGKGCIFIDYLGADHPAPEFVSVYRVSWPHLGPEPVVERITRREAEMKVLVGELQLCDSGTYRLTPQVVAKARARAKLDGEMSEEEALFGAIG